MIIPCSKEFTLTINPPVVPYYAYYKLDEATLSTALIEQVSGYTLNATSYQMTSTTGKIGTAFDMGSGINTQFENGPSAHWVFNDSFTVRLWIKTAATPGTYLLFGNGIGDEWYIRYFGGAVAKLQFTVQTSGGAVTVQSDDLTDGVWNQVVFWFEQGVGLGCKVNNGVAVLQATTDPIDPPFSGTETLYLFSSHFLAAGNAIDEIAVWSHKLTDGEMTIDWNGGAGTTYTH